MPMKSAAAIKVSTRKEGMLWCGRVSRLERQPVVMPPIDDSRRDG